MHLVNSRWRLAAFPNKRNSGLWPNLTGRLGSAKRALRAYVQGGGAEGVSWDEVRVRFGIGQPSKRRWEILMRSTANCWTASGARCWNSGACQSPRNIRKSASCWKRFGTPKLALRIFLQKGGAEEMKRAAENRRRDLLVYVALANLRKRVPFGHLSMNLRFGHPGILWQLHRGH